MMIPIITAAIAEIKTEAAAISLIRPAKGFVMGSIRSTKLSKAVLIISVIKTMLMASTIQSQSNEFMSR